LIFCFKQKAAVDQQALLKYASMNICLVFAM